MDNALVKLAECQQSIKELRELQKSNASLIAASDEEIRRRDDIIEIARVRSLTLEDRNKFLREDLVTLEIGLEEEKVKTNDLGDQVNSSKSRVIKKNDALLVEKVKNTELTSKYSKMPNIMAVELKTALTKQMSKGSPCDSEKWAEYSDDDLVNELSTDCPVFHAMIIGIITSCNGALPVENSKKQHTLTKILATIYTSLFEFLNDHYSSVRAYLIGLEVKVMTGEGMITDIVGKIVPGGVTAMTFAHHMKKAVELNRDSKVVIPRTYAVMQLHDNSCWTQYRIANAHSRVTLSSDVTKSKSSVFTDRELVVIKDDNNLQFDPNLHPSRWELVNPRNTCPLNIFDFNGANCPRAAGAPSDKEYKDGEHILSIQSSVHVAFSDAAAQSFTIERLIITSTPTHDGEGAPLSKKARKSSGPKICKACNAENSSNCGKCAFCKYPLDSVTVMRAILKKNANTIADRPTQTRSTLKDADIKSNSKVLVGTVGSRRKMSLTTSSSSGHTEDSEMSSKSRSDFNSWQRMSATPVLQNPNNKLTIQEVYAK